MTIALGIMLSQPIAAGTDPVRIQHVVHAEEEPCATLRIGPTAMAGTVWIMRMT